MPFAVNVTVKMMLHETIRNDDFYATKCYNFVATLFGIVTTMLHETIRNDDFYATKCYNFVATLFGIVTTRRCESYRVTSL